MKVGWCVSGQGMAMRAAVAAYRAGLSECQIVAVVTDRPLPVARFCEEHEIPHTLVAPSDLSRFLIDLRERRELDWLMLNFNRFLKPDVIAAYQSRILNMHLSLLPLFPGLEPSAKAIASGMRMGGVSLHLIDEGMDTGPIVAQAACPILPGDDAGTLGKRQFDAAVPLLLQTIRAIARGDLQVDDGRAIWSARESDSSGGFFPAIDADIAAFAAAFCARI